MKLQKCFLFSFITLSCVYCLADSNSLEKTTDAFETEHENFFELGISVGDLRTARIDRAPYDQYDSSFLITLAGEYNIGRFFLRSGSFSEVLAETELGFRLWSNDHWDLDIIAASLQGMSHLEEEIPDSLIERVGERDAHLIYRDSNYIGTGFRLLYYGDDVLYRYSLQTDALRGRGINASIYAGKRWQLTNRLSLFGVLGGEYNSSELNNYVYGIQPDEATPSFEEYSAGSSVDIKANFGLAYPLTRDWVLRASAGIGTIDSEIKKSPLSDKSHTSFWDVSLSYVF